MVIFTLMTVNVETESENWNFLKYGRIGKHPMQSLYTRYYIPSVIATCIYSYTVIAKNGHSGQWKMLFHSAH